MAYNLSIAVKKEEINNLSIYQNTLDIKCGVQNIDVKMIMLSIIKIAGNIKMFLLTFHKRKNKIYLYLCN